MLGQHTSTLHPFHSPPTLRAIGSMGSLGSLQSILHIFNEIFNLNYI
jgi:hypothetical protein